MGILLYIQLHGGIEWVYVSIPVLENLWDFQAKHLRVDPEASVFCHLSFCQNSDLIPERSFLSELLWFGRVAVEPEHFSTCSVCHSLTGGRGPLAPR